MTQEPSLEGGFVSNDIKFPKIWAGYIFAVLFFIFEIVELSIHPDLAEKTPDPLIIIISIGAYIYWLFCVYKIHNILDKVTMHKYPIPSWKAVVYHFIPFYNIFYWIFKWPGGIVNFINNAGKTKMLKKWLPGLLLLCGMLTGRVIDGAVGLAVIFYVLSYLVKNMKKVLREATVPIESLK
ncbi:MAG: hypothetical protein ABH815_02725 [Candidatus Omnitrophota bacterium]